MPRRGYRLVTKEYLNHTLPHRGKRRALSFRRMELINNSPLKSFTTFGVEATCDHLYRVEDFEELKLAVQFLENPLILGGGSNVLPIGDIHRNVLRIEMKG